MLKSPDLVPLADLGEIVSGSTPRTEEKRYWHGDIPWVTPADLTKHQGVWFQGAPKRITKAGMESCSTRLLPKGTILFSSRAPIGHCAVASYPVCTNQGFKSLVPNEHLDPVYGFFALTFAKPRIVALGRGATFAEISKELMESVRIPVPGLEQQRKVARELAKADRLRRLRRSAMQMVSDTLESVFIGMFGDPGHNGKGWPQTTIDEVIESSQYGVSERSNSFGKGYPILGMGNITEDGEVDLQHLSHVELSDDQFRQLKLQPGDIIFNRTNSTDLVGKTACWTGCLDAVLASYLVRLRLKHNVLPGFFVRLLNTRYFKVLFQQRCKKAVGQSNISPTLLREFKICLPPFELQEEFVRIVDRLKDLMAQQRESERQAEHLFETLLHGAFEGAV